MKIGFTGTSSGMTPAQKDTLAKVLPVNSELHHGDCIGSDAECHVLARAYHCHVVIHPHNLGKYKKAFCQGDEERPAAHPLTRNNNIVEETSWLIATPKGFIEELRSGTWSTVRRARKRNRKITIIWPDGNMKEE